MQFAEEYNNKYRKISMLLFILFELMLVFSIPILKKINNQFLIDNANFVFYSVFFVIFLIVYKKIIVNSIKKIDTNNFKYLAIYMLTTIMSMVIIAIVIDKFGIVNINESNELGTNRILNFFAAVIFGTFVEELLFRYFIFREALRINKIFAIIFTALIFGFSHVWYYVLIQGKYEQLVSSLIYVALGLNECLLYSKTRNICFPLLLHIAINFIALMN